MPFIPILLGIGALGVGGWTLKQAGDAADEGADLAKWLAVAGGVYLTYRIAKKAGRA